MVNIPDSIVTTESDLHDRLPSGFHATRFIFSGKCFDVNGERVIIKKGFLLIKLMLPLKSTKSDAMTETPFKIKVKIATLRRVDIIGDSDTTLGATAFVIHLSPNTTAKIVKAMHDVTGSDFISLHYENCFLAFECLQNWKQDRGELTNLMESIKEVVTQYPERPYLDFALNYISAETFDKLILWAGYKLQLTNHNGIASYQFVKTEIPPSYVSSGSKANVSKQVETSIPEKPQEPRGPPRKAAPASGYKVAIKDGTHSFSHNDLCSFFDTGFAGDSMIDFAISRLLKNFDDNVLDRVLIAPASYFGRMFYEFESKQYNEAETKALIEKTYNKLPNHRPLNDAFDKHFVILPSCRNLHWYLTIIMNPAGPVISGDRDPDTSPDCHVIIMDSLLMDISAPMDVMHRDVVNWISTFLKIHYMKRQPLNFLPFGEYNRARVSRLVPYSLQQQQNGHDCGLFVLFYLEQFLKHVPKIQTSDPPQIDDWIMPKFDAAALRRELVFEILDQNNVDRDWFVKQLKPMPFLRNDLLKLTLQRPVMVADTSAAAAGDAQNIAPTNGAESTSISTETTTKSKLAEMPTPADKFVSKADAVTVKANGAVKSKSKQDQTSKPKSAENNSSNQAESTHSNSNKKPSNQPVDPPKIEATPSTSAAAPTSSSVAQNKPAANPESPPKSVPQKRKKPEVIRGRRKKVPRKAPEVGAGDNVFYRNMGLEPEHEEAESEAE